MSKRIIQCDADLAGLKKAMGEIADKLYADDLACGSLDHIWGHKSRRFRRGYRVGAISAVLRVTSGELIRERKPEENGRKTRKEP